MLNCIVFFDARLQKIAFSTNNKLGKNVPNPESYQSALSIDKILISLAFPTIPLISVFCRMISEQVVPAINESTTQLLRAVNRFSSHRFNEVPPGSGWSPGQIAEHILLTDIFISRILQKDLEFAGRKTDEKVSVIKEIFEDGDQKLNAPEFTIPSDMLKDPVTMQEKISRERHFIIHYLNTIEEDAICSSYSHPAFGTLTITEWSWYIVYHTWRHVHQLEKMSEEVVN